MHVGPAACLSPLRLQVKTGTSVVLQACTFNVCTIVLTEKGLLLSNHWKTLEKSKEREALRQAGMGSFSQEEALGFLFDLISRVLIILLPIVTGFFLLDLCEGRCALCFLEPAESSRLDQADHQPFPGKFWLKCLPVYGNQLVIAWKEKFQLVLKGIYWLAKSIKKKKD